MKKGIDWIIHFVVNGAKCACCDEVEDSFLPYMCNCHTHGMERYNHLNFQIVLSYSPEEISRVLNTLGMRVRDGERFKNGDLVEGIYADCKVRLSEFTDNGHKVLRVIIPDKQYHFPEDEGCAEPHVFQMLETKCLEKEVWPHEN